MTRRAPVGRVIVVGAGKVGRALASALRAREVEVVLLRGRGPLRRRDFAADLVVIAVADPFVPEVARAIVDRIGRGVSRPDGARRLPRAVVHVAGALDVEALGAFRSVSVPVGQMHPLLSFAGAEGGVAAFSLVGSTVRVSGDPTAVRAARRVSRVLGMVPRHLDRVPAAAYHASAALVANGAVALAASAADLLARHGVARDDAAAMFGPLLASVAANVSALGLPGALTGPVRRGDAATIERHLAVVGPSRELYLALAAVQLDLAAQLDDASAADLGRVRRVLRASQNRSKRGR